MEQLILIACALVVVATLCTAVSMARTRNGRSPTPLRLLASFALTLPAQSFGVAAALLLYVDIMRPDPGRLRNMVLASGSLLGFVAAVYALRILKTDASWKSRAFGIGAVLAVGSAALALLLVAAYG